MLLKIGRKSRVKSGINTPLTVVARMDSDDIAYPNRCEKQIAFGAQRYQHHQQYLYPSGFFQQGILCQCHRQHFPGEHKGMICNKNKAARNLKKSGLLAWCRWWDSNPHGFPSDFESLASAIPPHRLIWIWMRFARFFGSWRDVQEGCWNLSNANWSKTFAASLKFQMGAQSREADFESPSSAIPTHRRMFLNDFYYTGFHG